MKVTKFGHCCLLLEIDGKRILTDPGKLSDGQNALSNIDVILITHEHFDHLHTESVAAICAHNPQVEIITNTSVGKLLAKQGITFSVLEGKSEKDCAGLNIKAYDGEHVEIFEEYGLVQNTGYAVNNGEFFFPGDAYTKPEGDVRVLAAPVAGPWCKVSEAIRYALEVGAAITIPVHDAVLSEAGKQVTYTHFAREIEKSGNVFVPLELGVPTEL